MAATDDHSVDCETLIEQLESAQASLEEALANLEDAVASYEGETDHSDTSLKGPNSGHEELDGGWITSDTTVSLTDWR
jgi:hypothetical protein